MFRYTCHLQPCTKRKQGYKEIVLHLATQHQRLKEVMLVDKRPGVAEAAAVLFPPKEEKALTEVKEEEENRVASKESEDTEKTEDNPKAVIGSSSKTSSGAKLTSVQQVGDILQKFVKVKWKNQSVYDLLSKLFCLLFRCLDELGLLRVTQE